METAQGYEALSQGISNAVRTLRRAAGLTQVDLAKISGVNQSVISRMERQGCNSIELLCKVINSMNCDVDISFTERSEAYEPLDSDGCQS